MLFILCLWTIIFLRKDEKTQKQLLNNTFLFKQRNTICIEIQELQALIHLIDDYTETMYMKNTSKEPKKYKNMRNRRDKNCKEN